MFCRSLISLLLPLLLITHLHAQVPPLYQSGFEGPAFPAGWLPLSGQWSLSDDETNSLQQSQPSFRGQARVVMQESNYQVEATCRALNVSGQWGVGLVGYWQASGDCYRLSNFGNMLVLWRESHGSAEALAAVKMDFKPQGYRMRLALSNQGPVTLLRGKVWALGEAEPQEHTITGEDGAAPLRYGRAGVFTGRASAIFTEFALTRLSTMPSASATPVEAGTPPVPGHWLLVGGDWQLQRDNLRQNAPGSTLGFHASAYAIAAGWQDYTVQVNAKSATGSRNQGYGLSAYWLDDGNHYEFGQMGDRSLALLRRSGGSDPVFLATTPLTVKKGLWYVLKLQLQNTAGGIVLRGKAWPAHAGEPTKWQIEAEDVARPVLAGGDVGLWALDDVCSFDEIRVTENQ